jgi:hypothetical protein
LGMDYILYQSKKILKPHDIAILPLEYSFYQVDGLPSEVYIDYIFSRDVEYFKSLPFLSQISIVFSTSFERLFNGYKYFITSLKKTSGVYGIQNINKYGDQINIDFNQMTENDFIFLNSLNYKRLKSSNISKEFEKLMNEYIQWANDNQIKVVFMPPNYMHFTYYDSNEYLEFLNNIYRFYQDKNLIFIGDSKKYMYEKNLYYNSVYHLNDKGVEIRTNQIINDLKNNILWRNIINE